jgi:hypothetical protein
MSEATAPLLFEVPDPFDSLAIVDGKIRVNLLLPLLGSTTRTTATKTLHSYCRPGTVTQIPGGNETWWIDVEEARASVGVYRHRALNAVTYGKDPIRGKATIWGKDMRERAWDNGWIPRPVTKAQRKKTPKAETNAETPQAGTLIDRVETAKAKIQALVEEINRLKTEVGLK